MSEGPERYGLSFVGRAQAERSLHADAATAIVPDPTHSIGFHDARDVVVVGDNLEVLKVVAPAYFARVQLVYIDPPYNTGKDFVYRDDFTDTRRDYLVRSQQTDHDGNRLVANPETAGRYHSAWLTMMYPRLVLAHRLLRDDGILLVSIDDHEVHNLRLLLDEIFGSECFIAQVVVIGNRGGRDWLPIAVTHEYLLCYGKTTNSVVGELPRRQRTTLVDARGPFELRELRNRNPRFHPRNRPNLFYPLWVRSEGFDGDGLAPVAVEPLPGYDLAVEPRNSRGEGSVWRWSRDRVRRTLVDGDDRTSDVVARRRRDGGWNIYEKDRKTTTKARSVWDEKEFRSEQGTRMLGELLGAAVFDHPKPVELVRRCIEIGCPDDGIVMDFFAGSGTTGQAVIEQDAADGRRRRYVLVQLDEPTPEGSIAREHGHSSIAEVCIARIASVLERTSSSRGVRVFRTTEPAIPKWRPPSELSAETYLESMRAHMVRSVPVEHLLWEVLASEGVQLDSAVVAVADVPQTWRVFVGDRILCVCLAETITAALLARIDLAPGSRFVCLDRALDGSLAARIGDLWDIRPLP